MQHIALKNCHQIEFTSLDNLIEIENTVRFVDAFVDKLALNKLVFTLNTVKKEGRSSYHSALFLKSHFRF
jgi:3'-phosphoadenosine 5'-phosphosulfate sulfotransferase (PAPS reductase)/FAD synthetase